MESTKIILMRSNALTSSSVRALLAGFVAGIIAAAACFGFVWLYRSATGNAYNVISPLTLFVGIPVLLTLSGLLFSWLKRYVHRGTMWYSVLFMLLVVFVIIIGLLAPGKISLEGYKGVLVGIEVITGLAAIFLVPFLARLLSIFRSPQEV